MINQNLLQPYDKSCRSYFLFLSDVLRTRDVLGPQTDNHVVLIPRSTQWKLQEFLTSKEASDIINLLVIGESLTTDPTKVSVAHMHTEVISIELQLTFGDPNISGEAICFVHTSFIHRRIGLKYSHCSNILDKGEVVQAKSQSISAQIYQWIFHSSFCGRCHFSTAICIEVLIN